MHRNAANTATNNMAQNIDLKIVRIAESIKRKKQYAAGCEYVHVKIDKCQLTVKYTAGICGGICDQFIDTRNRKFPVSTKALVHAVCKIEIHDVVLPEIFAKNSVISVRWSGSKTVQTPETAQPKSMW